MTRIDLSTPDVRDYEPGRSFAVRALWLIAESLVLLNPVVTSYGIKRAVLRLFGARLGARTVIKPGVHVKYPWRLTLGDHVWLGERCWIDNLADVVVGSHVVVSQGAYLCTGNHDWADERMGLVTGPISLGDGSWVGAFARVGPGVTVGREAVVALGAVLTRNAEPGTVYSGNPATPGARRRIGGS